MNREELIRKLDGVSKDFQKVLRSQGAHEPDWEPLERVLPIAWCGGFMFMGYFDHIRLYKHGLTRRYLNVDPQGNTYRFDGRNSYQRITLDEALDSVFDGLEEMGYERSTPYDDEVRAERHRRIAAAGWTVIDAGPRS